MKVLIRAPNWVGDSVMALPALRELRRIFGGAHLTLLARSTVAGLFDGEGVADELIPIEDASGLAGSVRSFFAQSRRLRRERFDLAVLLQNAFGAALIARVGCVRTVVGYPTDGRRALLHLVIPLEPGLGSRHQVCYYMNIADRLERALKGESHVDTTKSQPQLHATEDALRSARRMLAEPSLLAPGLQVTGSPVLALNPGATNSRAKRWLAERFAAVADLFAERDGFRTAIVGAPGDVDAALETRSHMRTPAVMLAGKTSLAELKGLLACASLVISNDTGAAHVSAALGTPTVVIFGPTQHESTRPLSDAAAVVRREVECSPCMLRDCPIDHRCMTRVEVEEVYRAAKGLLAAKAESDASRCG